MQLTDALILICINACSSSFTDNTATGHVGGALAVAAARSMEVTNSSFTGNTAVVGGGIYLTGLQGTARVSAVRRMDDMLNE